MTINRTSLTARSITSETDNMIIEMRGDEPSTTTNLDPPQPPGKMIGYYNGSTGFVELYIVSANGLRLLAV